MPPRSGCSWCSASSVAADGRFLGSRALRHLPAPRLDGAFSINYGNLYYNPFHCLSIVFLYAPCCSSRCMAQPSWQFGKYGGERELEQITDRGTQPPNAPPCSGAGPWAQRDDGIRPPLGLVVLPS